MRNPSTSAVLLAGLFALTLVRPDSLSSAPQDRGPGDRRRAERNAIELASGARVEFSSFASQALKEDREFSIFLPPTYGKSDRSYPVVYFLHGLNNDGVAFDIQQAFHAQ